MESPHVVHGKEIKSVQTLMERVHKRGTFVELHIVIWEKHVVLEEIHVV